MMMLAGLTATAQTSHLTFKGIPIDGTLNTFVGKLKQKGFTQFGNNDGIAILKGEFASYKGCYVLTSQNSTGIVSKVLVMFPEKENWSTLYDNYISLKEMLTKKYGESTAVVEEFQGYSSPHTDNDKMHEVRMDRCKYICDFTTENGTIELAISHSDDLGCFVTLIYNDAINSEKVQSSAIDDL